MRLKSVVGQRPDAVACHLEAVGVVPAHGLDPQAPHLERTVGVDLVQRDLGHAAILVAGKGVVEVLAHDGRGAGRGVEVDAVDGRRVVDEVEGAHVVDAARVVLVLVREQDGVEVPHPVRSIW